MDGTPETDDKVCLKRIGEALATVKVDTKELEKVMKKFFGQE